MNIKAWVGFFAGAFAASIGSYVIVHHQPTPTAPVAVVQEAPAAPEASPAKAPAKRTVKKKAASAAAELAANDAGPAAFKGNSDSQPAALTTPQPAPAPVQQPTPLPAQEELAAPLPGRAHDVPPPSAPLPPVDKVPEPPHSVTIAAGTLVSVRLNDTLTTKKNQTGDSFSATLDQPLVVDGFVIAEKGARVDGRVVQVEQAGRVKGVARLLLELTRINTADGQRVDLHTESFEKLGPTSKKEDAAKIGAGAVLGTIIGAVAGGGKGAAIGAGAGGAAGAGTVAATRGKPAELPVETRISFKLEQPVTITEQRR